MARRNAGTVGGCSVAPAAPGRQKFRPAQGGKSSPGKMKKQHFYAKALEAKGKPKGNPFLLPGCKEKTERPLGATRFVVGCFVATALAAILLKEIKLLRKN